MGSSSGTYQLAHQWFPKLQAGHLLASGLVAWAVVVEKNDDLHSAKWEPKGARDPNATFPPRNSRPY